MDLNLINLVLYFLQLHRTLRTVYSFCYKNESSQGHLFKMKRKRKSLDAKLCTMAKDWRWGSVFGVIFRNNWIGPRTTEQRERQATVWVSPSHNKPGLILACCWKRLGTHTHTSDLRPAVFTQNHNLLVLKNKSKYKIKGQEYQPLKVCYITTWLPSTACN